MKSGKDEVKPMLNPLFPRLHINDADKGGQRAPPRNRMALCEQYNAPSESPRFNSGSMSMMPIRPSNGRDSFAQQASSSQVGGSQQKVLPTFYNLPGSSHLVERYRSHSSSGVRDSEPRAYNNCCKKRCIDEIDYRIPSYGHLELHLDEEEITTFNRVSSAKLQNACLKQPKETRSEDQLGENQINNTDEGSKYSQDTITDGMRKRRASVMDDALHFYPRLGDKDRMAKIEMIKKCSKDTDFGPLQVANVDTKQEISDTSVEESVPVLDLTPDDVVEVIGQRLFWKARNTILHQQRTFTMQIFELHRLIKVQKLIAGSPEVLHENNFNLNEPSRKFRPMNELLVVTKHKLDAENGHLAKRSTPKPSPTPAAASIHDAKLAPLCFHPPPNQWLVPVKSPSEGLIYKPYTAACPPANGIRGPVFGNCGPPISLNTLGETAYRVPAPDHRGIIARFSGTAFGQSHLQPYAIPLVNNTGLNLEIEQNIPSDGAQSTGTDKHSSAINVNFAILNQSCYNVDLNGSRCSDKPGSNAISSPVERLQGYALSLFPTTTSSHVSKDQCNGQSVQVIKVVPHNPKSAPESAARIFQSIQEERSTT